MQPVFSKAPVTADWARSSAELQQLKSKRHSYIYILYPKEYFCNSALIAETFLTKEKKKLEIKNKK